MIRTMSVAAAALLAIALAWPANAAQRKPAGQQIAAVPGQQTVYRYTDENGRRRTKIIVQRRSYLDAGTWVLPGQRKYNYSDLRPYSDPFGDVLGPGKGAYDRNPLGPRWEFGGGGY